MVLSQTLTQFLSRPVNGLPGTDRRLSRLLQDIAFAGKMISLEVNKAGLTNILGNAGYTNVHGECQQKLDVYANEQFIDALRNGGECCMIMSEENEEVILLEDEYENSSAFVVAVDPLDGSSNIDVNIAVGSIFSVYRRLSKPGEASLHDALQKGREQVAAGYIVYSSSTMLVFTTGNGVNGFTLDPSIGEFRLSHPDMRIPADGRIYAVNDANHFRFDASIQDLIRQWQTPYPESRKQFSARYVGSLVADIHRTLIKGGIFMYPATDDLPLGKLRLVYECNPIAFIIEQAGGKATHGLQPILDVEVNHLHQRAPLFVGSQNLLETGMPFIEAAAIRNQEIACS